MKVEYQSYDERKIHAPELMNLYRCAGWWEERQRTDIDRMLESTISVGAWKDGELIGFARALSDGKFRAYIEDVVIHIQYQKAGIGRVLVAKLLEELSPIDIISLFCKEELIPFYEKNNFNYSKSQFVMHRKRMGE